MQQTQSRTNMLMRQCGKRVQRVARIVPAKLRKRGMRAARVAALLLLLMALFIVCCKAVLTYTAATQDSRIAEVIDRAPPVALPSPDSWLVRPDGHGGSVRVVLFMISTRIDEQLCYALASAYFVDLPIVVLGYGGKYKSHIWRWSVYVDAVQRAGLRDSDVVMLLDSDTLFSGEDVLPFIDDYIARSPADASALDVRAVRAGTALAPSMYVAETYCAMQHYAKNRRDCAVPYNKADDVVASYAAAHGLAYDIQNKLLQPARYLNGGVSIHRVWSMMHLHHTFNKYIAVHTPPLENAGGWHDDQSVFALLYNELRTWEVAHDVLRNTTAAATLRSPQGLLAGQMQLDQSGRLGSFIYQTIGTTNYVSTTLWEGTADTGMHIDRYDDIDTQQYADDVWRRYADSVRMQQRTLTRTRNATHTIAVTPPLLFVIKQNNAKQGTCNTTIVTPHIFHFTEGDKVNRMKKGMVLLPWYVPMRHDATKWQQGREHVLSSLIELWTSTNVTKRVRYGDVCQEHHPFLTPPPPPSS